MAAFFLTRQDHDAGELITHLKLQKLCYYAQGFHLAIFDVPLFMEEIEAWEHGPVIPDLWFQYKGYGSTGIPAPSEIDLSAFDGEVEELLDEVYDVYGQFSAWKLRNLTHDEPPWIEAFSGASTKVIPHEAMRSFFKTLVAE